MREVDDQVLSPFAAVTPFAADVKAHLASCADYAQLLATLDRLRDSENIFYAFRVDGRFNTMHTRAVCKTEEAEDVADAKESGMPQALARSRAEEAIIKIEGSLVLARVLRENAPFLRTMKLLPDLLTSQE